MPPKAVKTIKDLIYWEYAKLISGSAGLGRKQYPFVMKKFMELKKGIIREVHNIITSCKKCNSSKGDKDLIEWYGLERRYEIPRIVMGKYLKMIYICHECRGTLNKGDINKNGILNVLDLGAIFKEGCIKK
jgi:hypothetical protein